MSDQLPPRTSHDVLRELNDELFVCVSVAFAKDPPVRIIIDDSIRLQQLPRLATLLLELHDAFKAEELAK